MLRTRSGFAPSFARFHLLFLALVIIAAAGTQAHAAGTFYYIDGSPGSNCSDSGPHSKSLPWCTFGPANSIGTFFPGDQILLARGSSWNQELSLRGQGTSDAPITLGAYGEGPAPKILRNQQLGDICVLLNDPSHWNISDLEVGQANVGILLHYTQLFNNGISIRNIYAHDNKGIWAGYSTQYPVHHHVLDPFAASLNINLSAGILFNVASYLNYSSSQYVLKGVTVNEVTGTGNVDSVAFDAENDTIDQQDGHNAFQDVVLSGLFLSNDNGHADKVYQRAGLGCSDGLRLIGMTNLTLMNSILYNEAGCRTETGTAAVILGRVSHVLLVNNIIFGVPSSDSPDETGIDFEWSEDHVSLVGNLFAANAGAGLEILNIHDEDHTTAIDLDSNTFIGNAGHHQPGASSIWEDNKGRGYAIPQGTVRNNVYFEHGKFFEGRRISMVASLNNSPTARVANYAAEEFSSTQGKNQWRYMYERGDSVWTDLPRFSPDYNGAWEASPTQYVSAFAMSPASCKGTTCAPGGVARVWVAPFRGVVRIRGRVLAADNRAEGGVNAVINLVSGENVTQIWPPPSGRQQIPSAEQAGYATNLDQVPVQAGDMIRFEVRSTGDNPVNAVSWTPSIGYIEAAPGRSEEASSAVVPNPASGSRLPSPTATKVHFDVPRAAGSQSAR